MNDFFEIPVVFFIFKRKETSLRILDRIRAIRPKKLYLLADEGRDEQEKMLAAECRNAVEAAVDWPCTLIRDYAERNRGVYQNIGMGAKRVLSRESCAIFLEDDNLPELTFFRYCEEMLTKYWDHERVLWICGTNYLGDYAPEDGVDYTFTQHMLPCGWASWSHKFVPYYDGELSVMDEEGWNAKVRAAFEDKKLFRMYYRQWVSEKKRIEEGRQPASWDYQMCLTLRANGLLGVVPMKNQIRNIGVDDFSTHGGSSWQNVMTERYCGMDSYPLEFPLTGPEKIEKEKAFEKKLGKIILPPFRLRVRIALSRGIKKLLGLPEEVSLRSAFQR